MTLYHTFFAERKPGAGAVQYCADRKGRLSDAQVLQIVALLDEVSPRGVLTEFTAELRRSLQAP